MLLVGVLLVVQALLLANALDLPAGSCAFEEGTCGFDSVFAFLPWILNEEVSNSALDKRVNSITECLKPLD